MKAQSEDEIIYDIENYLKNFQLDKCFIGLATDVSAALFEKHNVSRRNDFWIFKTVASNKKAKAIKKYFLKKGMNKCEDDSSDTARIIFAFKKK